MEGRGQRLEAESSSAPARVVPPESSDDPGDDTRVYDNDNGDDEADGDEDEDADADWFVPSPLIPLKDQLEKDKEDESLRRWKEKLLGCIDGDLNGQIQPEVMFHSIGVISEGCAILVTSLPIAENQSRVLFTLKEGSKYRLKLTFTVRHNIVSGLTYSNTVWKRGLKVITLKLWLFQWIKARECLVRLLLSVIPLNICLKKKLLHPVCLLEESTLQNLSSKTTTRDAIWNLTTTLKSRSVEHIGCVS